MDQDDFEAGLQSNGCDPQVMSGRPATAELSSEAWVVQLLAGLDGEPRFTERAREVVRGDVVEDAIEDDDAGALEVEAADDDGDAEADEAAWAAALAAARARADAAEPVIEEDGGEPQRPWAHEQPVTAPVPAVPLEDLLDEARRDWEAEEVAPAAATAASAEAPVARDAAVTADGAYASDAAVTADGAPPEDALATADGHDEPAPADGHDEPAPAEAPAAADAAHAEALAPLVDALRAGRAVLCAGPRLGGAQPVRDVLARLSATLPSDAVREVWPVLQSRPWSAAGFVARRLGDGFAGALRAATTRRPGGVDAVARFAALPFRGVLTCDGDDAFAGALGAGGEPPAVYTPRDGEALGRHGRAPFVVQLLGDPRRPETLTWSHEALQEALADRAWREALHTLWRTRSFLFVGFEPGDLELQLVLERVLAGARPGEHEHFALLPGASAVETEELWAGWRVRVLPGGDAAALATALSAALAASERLPADDDAEGWLALLAADPGRDDARRSLERIAAELRERGEHEALLELLLGRADLENEPARRGALLLQLARLFEHDLEDPARALTSLLAAYKQDPALAAWHELERLASACDGWDTVTADLGPILPSLPAAVRAPLCRRLERWGELVQALDALGAEAGDGGRARRLEAAEVAAEHLGDRAAAIARYEALAAEAPGDLDVLRALDRLYEQEGQTVEYLENLERQAHATSDPTERAALFRRLALSWEEERGGALRAEQCWQTLLTIEPEADDALRALERAYRAGRRVPALIEALARRAALADGEARAELYLEIGALWERELDDREKALESYLLAEAAAPEHTPTLQALARIYDETGAWHLAVARLGRLAERAATPAEALPLWLRAGELAAARLDDAVEAERCYTRVLELDPTHVGALGALAALHKSHGAPLRAARLLADAAAQVPGRVDKTALLVEAAAIYESLDDAATATELYLAALAVDPEHPRAAARAAELLWQAQRSAELVPVLEVLTRPEERALGPDERATLVERLVRLGRAARSAGLPEKAARAFARAAALDAANLEAQRAHADELLAAADWAGALRALERIFQHHVDALPPAERAALFCDLSRCELMLGAVEGAREFVRRALQIDPLHRASLELQAELCGADPEALIEAKRALAVAAPPAEQVRLLGEVGDLCAERLGDRDRALGAWAEALELAPDDHRLLHKCLDAYVEERAWPEALGLLERLVAVERVPRVRAKYRHAAALICRDELGRPAEAVAHLRGALDDDPAAERSARALEELLIGAGDWTELARLYRRLLKTLGAESPGDADGKNGERLRIWSALGALCLERLREPASAVAALEAALSFDRDNLERHRQLADLYLQAGPDAADKAIAEHQWVLRRDKGRVASYRALKQLYTDTRQHDKATACSYALHFLRKGDADDAVAVIAARKRVFSTARRFFDDETWARLAHPDEDRLIDLLFSLVGSTVAAGHAQPRRLVGLDKKQAIAADDARSYAKVLAYVATTLDVPTPEAYARPGERESVGFVNVVERNTLVPVFLLGAPLCGDKRSEAEQVFELARKAALLRPERFLRLAMPHPQQLGHVIDAAIALAAEADGLPAPVDALGRTVAGFKRALPPPKLEQVIAIGDKLRETVRSSQEAALGWLQASDLTALRVGYALAGDLETCARLVATDGRPAGTLPPTERLLDLVWSSVTEELFAARRHLGLG